MTAAIYCAAAVYCVKSACILIPYKLPTMQVLYYPKILILNINILGWCVIHCEIHTVKRVTCPFYRRDSFLLDNKKRSTVQLTSSTHLSFFFFNLQHWTQIRIRKFNGRVSYNKNSYIQKSESDESDSHESDSDEIDSDNSSSGRLSRPGLQPSRL